MNLASVLKRIASAKAYAFANRQRLFDDLVEPYVYSMTEKEIDKASGKIKVGTKGMPPTMFIAANGNDEVIATAGIVYDDNDNVVGHESPMLGN